MFFVMLLVSIYIIVHNIMSWVFLTSEFAGSMMAPVAMLGLQAAILGLQCGMMLDFCCNCNLFEVDGQRSMGPDS